jgi:hypothetical protein
MKWLSGFIEKARGVPCFSIFEYVVVVVNDLLRDEGEERTVLHLYHLSEKLIVHGVHHI